jgi:RNA recognition motif-containing protein
VTLHVGNLPFAATDADLMTVFEGLAPKSAHIVMNNGRSRGYGFVDFVNNEDATKALKSVEGTQVEGRTIEVAFARQRVEPTPGAHPAQGQGQGQGQGPRKPYGGPRRTPQGPRKPRVPNSERTKSTTTVYVGKLAFAATEEDVKTALAKFAPKGVKIVTRANGLSRGFAFVEFETEEKAKAALAMNDMEIKGMKIKADIAFNPVDPEKVPEKKEQK